MKKENNKEIIANTIDTLLKGKILNNSTIRSLSGLSIIQILSGINLYYSNTTGTTDDIHCNDANEYSIGLAAIGKLKEKKDMADFYGLEGVYTTFNHITNHDPIPTNALLSTIELFNSDKHMFLYGMIDYFKPGTMLYPTLRDIAHLNAVLDINREKIRLESLNMLNMDRREERSMYSRYRRIYINDPILSDTYTYKRRRAN